MRIYGTAPLLFLYFMCCSINSYGESSFYFEASETQMITAMTNAFYGERYHGMILISEAFQFDVADHSWSRKSATNEWSLSSSTLPLSSVVWKGKAVPYSANFDIKLRQLDDAHCFVAVTTINSEIWEGKGTSIHGVAGWRTRPFPVVSLEETNVLSEIKLSLQLVRSNKTGSMPLTPDMHPALSNDTVQIKLFNPGYESMVRKSLSTNGAASSKPANQ